MFFPRNTRPLQGDLCWDVFALSSADANCTGRTLPEALIFASTNPQYDDRLIVELRVQDMKIASSKHRENKLCTQIVCFCFDIQNNLCTQHVLNMFRAWNFHVLNW